MGEVGHHLLVAHIVALEQKPEAEGEDDKILVESLKGIVFVSKAGEVLPTPPDVTAVYDATLTKVIDGTIVKVCAWYDNEWGFSNRMLDTALAWSKAK